MLLCPTDDVIRFDKTNQVMFAHNDRLWPYCQMGTKNFCWNKEFLSKFCDMYPFQLMKTVRLRAGLAVEVLADRR